MHDPHVHTVYRMATLDDIDQMSAVRMNVRENRLSSRSSIERDEYARMIEQYGRGWVAEEVAGGASGDVAGAATGKVAHKPGLIHGFAIGDARDGNIWALFMRPGSERRGHGRVLHALMVDWLFGTGLGVLWLGTDPDTRARRFYEAAGWRIVGPGEGGEVRMELTPADWEAGRQAGRQAGKR